jgi:ABC-type xylose transport system substrate-binding protein
MYLPPVVSLPHWRLRASIRTVPVSGQDGDHAALMCGTPDGLSIRKDARELGKGAAPDSHHAVTVLHQQRLDVVGVGGWSNGVTLNAVFSGSHYRLRRTT